MKELSPELTALLASPGILPLEDELQELSLKKMDGAELAVWFNSLLARMSFFYETCLEYDEQPTIKNFVSHPELIGANKPDTTKRVVSLLAQVAGIKVVPNQGMQDCYPRMLNYTATSYMAHVLAAYNWQKIPKLVVQDTTR
jgi:hypothetical protein